MWVVCKSLGCNLSQQEAVLQCVDHWLTLVQGPPGTGKTQVAAALVRSFNREGMKPVLAAATSNTATDNLARRLRNTNVTVRRVGPTEKIVEDLHDISTQHMSELVKGNAENPTAKKRRTEWEKDYVRHTASAVSLT